MVECMGSVSCNAHVEAVRNFSFSSNVRTGVTQIQGTVFLMLPKKTAKLLKAGPSTCNACIGGEKTLETARTKIFIYLHNCIRNQQTSCRLILHSFVASNRRELDFKEVFDLFYIYSRLNNASVSNWYILLSHSLMLIADSVTTPHCTELLLTCRKALVFKSNKQRFKNAFISTNLT